VKRKFKRPFDITERNAAKGGTRQKRESLKKKPHRIRRKKEERYCKVTWASGGAERNEYRERRGGRYVGSINKKNQKRRGLNKVGWGKRERLRFYQWGKHSQREITSARFQP